MVTLGVIGCGHWGPNHIRNFNSLPNSNVKSCADLDEKRLDQIRIMYPNINTTSDFMDILNDEEINAVVVSTPTNTHYKIAKSALEKGKDVLCEKPLTINIEESEELVEISNKLNRILMVGHVFLFNAGIQKLRELIKENELGKIYYVHCTRTNLGPIREDVNSVYDLASHEIYICGYLLNSEPDKIIAKGEDFLQPGIEDLAFISMSYPGKTLVNIHVSWLDPIKVRKITVVGDLRMAIWNDMDTLEPVRIFNKGVTKEPYYTDYGEFHYLTRDGDIHSPKIRLIEPLKNQAMHFIDCVENRKKPLSDGDNGLNVVKILNKIQASLKQNK
ncbi:MAG: Gfo/Idh/MocA family protein [Candidatus Aminicenantaceae bacterium]